MYTGKIEFKSTSNRPTINIAQHFAESTADVDDGNAPVRGQAIGSCEVFEESQRRPVGEREVIHLGEVDEAGTKCLKVSIIGVHELRQVVAAGKWIFFIVSTLPHYRCRAAFVIEAHVCRRQPPNVVRKRLATSCGEPANRRVI